MNVMNEQFYIKNRIAHLEARLNELLKHERVFPLMIKKIRREIENEKRLLEEEK